MNLVKAFSMKIEKHWIELRIHTVRSKKVMISSDLAIIYEVEPRTLMQAVKRNIERFPPDFMFQLTYQELTILKSQSVISSWGGLRTPPYVFTEQGIAMVSSVLKSKTSIRMNIEIMRTFVNLRQQMIEHKDLAEKIRDLESKYDSQFKIVFNAIKEILSPPITHNRKIGINQSDD